ncbi:hypothetical protein BVY01_00180 [bacterium I07]|nr:hypothetical protein BVY01_00180 [bacterium I07]
MAGSEFRGFGGENGYEGPVRARDFLGYHPKPTLSEHHRVKELLNAANRRLEEAENQMRILEKTKGQKLGTSGSHDQDITSSFGALFFWFRELEDQLVAYTKKVPLETEFEPRVRVLKRRIKILISKQNRESIGMC